MLDDSDPSSETREDIADVVLVSFTNPELSMPWLVVGDRRVSEKPDRSLSERVRP